MWLCLIMVIIGFAVGYYFDIPFHLVNGKFLALGFLALLDSATYGLARDLSGSAGNNAPVFMRLVLAVVIGGFIIYFGEKSGIDLYLVALLPIGFGLALNLYKFLPK